MSVIVTGMDMPKVCIDCHRVNCNLPYKSNTNREIVKNAYTVSVHKDCPLKSVEGLIEKVEQLKKSCANDTYGKCMANAISRVEKLIKEYCEVKE